MDRRTVPLRTKLLYGSGEISLSVKNTALGQFLLFFYVDVVHLAPAAVSMAIFCGRLWDAITDPLMGYVSDTTRSRWGRRRPYVVGAAVPVGLSFYLLFAPPLWGSTATVVYLGAIYVLLMTFFTVLAIPYLAWGAEIAEDYHERTSVVQIRSLFGVLGGVLGATAPVAIASQFAEQRSGFGAMGGILGTLLMLAALVTGLGVREQFRAPQVDASWAHFRLGLRQTFRNRDFRIVFMTFCLMTLSAAIGQSVQLFVVKYWLGMYDFFPVIALVFALSLAISFPFWMRLARRLGKRRALLIGLGIGCVSPLGWLLVAPGDRVAMLLFMLVAGAVTGSLTLAMSSAIDVVDFDEWETGERREGAYFGIWTLGLKTMGALGVLSGGGLLAWVGVDSRTVPSQDALWWLLLTVGPLQTVSHLVGFLVMRRFGFEANDVALVQAALAARRAAVPGPR